MTRVTIKTNAYAKNKNYLTLVYALIDAGYKSMTNVAIDGQVSVDTPAPRNVVEEMIKGMPRSVKIIH